MTPRSKLLRIMLRGSKGFHVRRRRTTTTTVSQYTSNIEGLQVSMDCANRLRAPQSPIENFQASIDEEGPGIVVRGRNGQQIHTHPGAATVIFSLKIHENTSSHHNIKLLAETGRVKKYDMRSKRYGRISHYLPNHTWQLAKTTRAGATLLCTKEAVGTS